MTFLEYVNLLIHLAIIYSAISNFIPIHMQMQKNGLAARRVTMAKNARWEM